MPSFQYVTLVASGGQPVRLADQIGAPYPTTGSGALVFSNGATLENVTIVGQVFPSPAGLLAGSVSAPSLYFATTDRGLYSTGTGNVSIAANGIQIAGFTAGTLINFNTANNAQLVVYSDLAGEVAVEAQQNVGSTSYTIDFNKYGGNVVIGGGLAAHATNDGNLFTYGHITISELSALPAGGDAYAALFFGTSTTSLRAGTGVPTVSSGRGSLYMRSDAPGGGAPYYNSDNGTTWVQLLAAGTPNFTSPWTVTLGTITASQPCTITETWNSGGTQFFALTMNVTDTASAASSRLISLQVGGSDRFYVDKSGTGVYAGSGYFGGSLNAETGSAIPAGGTQDFGINLTTTSHYGIYVGSGVPTASQARGSLYLRSDGLPYYNVNGTTTWDRLVGLASANAFTAANDFTGGSAIVTTQAIGNNTTLAASTAYADRAGLSNLVIKVTVQTATSTWTPDTNMVYAELECWGGGGGGGGTATTGALVASSGGSGGAGSYSKKTISKATAGSSPITTTIGAAGTAGTAGNNAGGNGGDTSIGAFCIGKGGTGGGGNSGGATATPGAGGIAGTGDVLGVGDSGLGGAGASSGSLVSKGGSSSVGSGGSTAAATATTGAAGTGHGSGGAGGLTYNATGTAAGGVGTSGYIVITEFCKA